MKTLIALLMAFAITANAQIYLVDTNTVHNVGGTLITGDPLPVAFTKIDLSLTWLNNFCVTNQSSNSYLFSVVGTLKTNLNIVSNMVMNVSGIVSNFSGTNILDGTVNSNKFDGVTYSWISSLGAGSTMNFDSGQITSDGSGNATFVSIFGQLKDSGYSTGSADYYAKANGSGGWYWTAWPSTLNYDSGTITSDGSGNLAGTSWRGGLLDNGWSSGSSGNVPISNGDGTWTWGGASGGSTMNFDSGQITSDGSGNITAGTVKSGLTDSGYSTGTYGYMPVAMGDGTWTWMAGALYPSNTWNLASITNGMKAGDIITVNSNGLKLVDVWMSNSTPVLKPHW